MDNDFLIFRCANASRAIRHHLREAREERRPYVFVTDTMRPSPLVGFVEHAEPVVTPLPLLVPVTMLEEEVYKAELCTYLARKTGAEIVLLAPNDVGSKAQTNIQRIITHIRSVAERTEVDIRYRIEEGLKDSFSLYREAAELTHAHTATPYGALILTASREYGLDDWLFGPVEYHAIRRSMTPVFLLNPREDLFSLCD